MKQWTKAALLASVLIVGFVLMSGCGGNNNPTGLSLTGTVERNFYSSFVGYSSMSEYYVTIVATNTGKPITFDALRIIYDGGNGEGLQSLTLFTSGDKSVTLNTGQSRNFESQTDGWTYDILQKSRAGKVALHVEFIKDGQVLDTFHAALPSLVKWKGGSTEMEYGEKVPLEFTRDYDAVMKKVRS